MKMKWTSPLLLLCLCVSVCPFSHLRTNLCKWCELSLPSCDQNVCLSNCSLTSFCSHTEEICIAIWRKSNDTMTVQTLCHHPALPLEGVDPDLLANASSRACHMVPQPTQQGAMFVCGCQGEHECNDRLVFDTGSNGFSRLQPKDVLPVVVVSLVPLLLVAVVSSSAFYLYRTRRPAKPRPPPHPTKPRPPPRPDWPAKRIPGCYQSLEQPGAGRGPWGGGAQPLPVQLEALVGKGRFAEVWRGRLLQGGAGEELVAVKVFPAVEVASWQRERAILSDAKLEHDNVVRFLAAEERHAHRKYWLVLAYHSLGNLQDFLAANILSWEELVAMAGSVARGLAHLHSDTTPTGVTKVPVAHRDMKSSNIVMKSRRECALCDFGLALKLDVSLTADDYANSGQVGTARYMAPEVLESRVNLEDLEAFKQMDVYSMALVMWEMTSRCQAVGEVRSYEPAFGSRVCDQPCVDSMRDIVLRDRGRPDIPTAWTQNQGVSALCGTISECWDQDPEARLTAHCVVERFNALQEDREGWREKEPDVSCSNDTEQEESGLSSPLPPPSSSSSSSLASCPAV